MKREQQGGDIYRDLKELKKNCKPEDKQHGVPPFLFVRAVCKQPTLELALQTSSSELAIKKYAIFISDLIQTICGDIFSEEFYDKGVLTEVKGIKAGMDWEKEHIKNT